LINWQNGRRDACGTNCRPEHTRNFFAGDPASLREAGEPGLGNCCINISSPVDDDLPAAVTISVPV
jgi:hypothetical protein